MHVSSEGRRTLQKQFPLYLDRSEELIKGVSRDIPSGPDYYNNIFHHLKAKIYKACSSLEVLEY